MYKSLHPKLKFIVLIINVVLIFFIKDLLSLLLFTIVTLIFMFISKTNILKYLKYMYFGIFFAIFTFVYTYVLETNLSLSLISSLRVLQVFILIYIYSIIFKVNSTNREVAYVMSWSLSPFSIFGYNQNKMYTTILIVLSSIYTLRIDIITSYKYELIKRDYKKGVIEKIKIVINLIEPFFQKVLYRNEISTLSLLNKDYNPNKKKVRFYINDKSSSRVVLSTIIVEILLFISVVIWFRNSILYKYSISEICVWFYLANIIQKFICIFNNIFIER